MRDFMELVQPLLLPAKATPKKAERLHYQKLGDILSQNKSNFEVTNANRDRRRVEGCAVHNGRCCDLKKTRFVRIFVELNQASRPARG